MRLPHNTFLIVKLILLFGIVIEILVLWRVVAFIKENQARPSSFISTSVVAWDDHFDPSVATVRLGDTVTWTNDGLKPHNVTFQKVSKTLLPHETWSWVIESSLFTKGENGYQDDFAGQGGIRGKLIVE